MAGKRSVAAIVVGFVFTFLGAEALPGPVTTRPKLPEPKKLTAWAYVTLRPVPGASKTTMAYVAQSASKGIPEERFEKLTVMTSGGLRDARRKALAGEADVFLHVVVDKPEKVKHTYRRTLRIGFRGRRRSITIDRSFYTLRSHVGVDMSLSVAGHWQRARTIKLNSAQAPPAEVTIAASDEKDITDKWGRGVKVTTLAAIETVLNEYFLRGVTVKAVESKSVDSKADADDAPFKPRVRIELTNRSHCRVIDVAVTVQQYNKQRKSWDELGGSGRSEDGGRRGERNTEQSKAVRWSFRAIVDPGEKAFSEELALPGDVFETMRRTGCRFVLHATPAVRKLTQPRTLHSLKPPPKLKP